MTPSEPLFVVARNFREADYYCRHQLDIPQGANNKMVITLTCAEDAEKLRGHQFKWSQVKYYTTPKGIATLDAEIRSRVIGD